MSAFSHHRLVKARFAWLLGLWLLFPLAQASATWHLAAHSQTGQRPTELAGSLEVHCDLCQLALDTLGGVEPRAP